MIAFKNVYPTIRWHCSTYPNCIELSDDLICELRAMVLHFITGIVFLRHHTQAVTPNFSLQIAGHRLMLTHRLLRHVSKRSLLIRTV